MHESAQPPQPVQASRLPRAGTYSVGFEPLTDLAGTRLGVDLQSSEEPGDDRMSLGHAAARPMASSTAASSKVCASRSRPDSVKAMPSSGKRRPRSGSASGRRLTRALEQIDSGRQIISGERRFLLQRPGIQHRSSRARGTSPVPRARPPRGSRMPVRGCLGTRGSRSRIAPLGVRASAHVAHAKRRDAASVSARTRRPDRDVAEVEALLALDIRAYGMDQLATDQRGEVDIEIPRQGIAMRFRHSPAMEGPPSIRELQQRSCSHRGDRCVPSTPLGSSGSSAARPRLASHGDQLLEEERITFGDAEEFGLVSGRRPKSLKLFEQLAGLRGRERFQPQHGGHAPAQGGSSGDLSTAQAGQGR